MVRYDMERWRLVAERADDPQSYLGEHVTAHFRSLRAAREYVRRAADEERRHVRRVIGALVVHEWRAESDAALAGEEFQL